MSGRSASTLQSKAVEGGLDAHVFAVNVQVGAIFFYFADNIAVRMLVAYMSEPRVFLRRSFLRTRGFAKSSNA